MLSLINVLSARLDKFSFIASITGFTCHFHVFKCNLETREPGNVDHSVIYLKQACFFMVSKGKTRPGPNKKFWDGSWDFCARAVQIQEGIFVCVCVVKFSHTPPKYTIMQCLWNIFFRAFSKQMFIYENNYE